MLEDLNRQFGRADLHFVGGPNGIAIAELANAHGAARVALYGGHVLSYTPRGGSDALFLSQRAVYVPGKAIRGGVPVCWPWFGPHPSDPSLPAHGFARTSTWEVRASDSDAGATRLTMGLRDDAATRAIWPHRFDLTLVVTLGAALDLALTAHNRGEEPFVLSAALHSYLAVGAIERTAVIGLSGTTYIDQIDGDRRKTQAGDITFAGEVDRIYLSDAAATIEDRAAARQIQIGKRGSGATVVWNPWLDKARRLTDLGEDAYPQFVCVETANAGDDLIDVAPGASHTLATTIAVR